MALTSSTLPQQPPHLWPGPEAVIPSEGRLDHPQAALSVIYIIHFPGKRAAGTQRADFWRWEGGEVLTRGRFFSWVSARVLLRGFLLPLALPCGVPLLTLETNTGQPREEAARVWGSPDGSRRDPAASRGAGWWNGGDEGRGAHWPSLKKNLQPPPPADRLCCPTRGDTYTG